MKRVSFPHFLVCVALLAAVFPALVANGQSEKLRVAISSISTSQVNVWVPLDTGFFNRTYLEHLVSRHESGARDYSGPIWSLLMFDAFLRSAGQSGRSGYDLRLAS